MQTQHHRPTLTALLRRPITPRSAPAAPPRLRALLRGTLLGAAAYILTRAPLLFSVNPLPLALLCAADTGPGWVLTGICLALWQGGLGEPTAPYLLAAALAALPLRLLARLFLTPSRPGDTQTPGQLRKLYFARRLDQLRQVCVRGLSGEGTSHAAATSRPDLPPLFDEPVTLRVAVALGCTLIPAIGIPIAGGFAVYDLYGAVLCLLLTPLCTALFCPVLTDRPPAVATLGGALTAWGGGALLLLAVCLCGRPLVVLGTAPVMVLAVVLCLMAVERGGLAASVALSLVCGLGYDVLVLPMLLCLGCVYAWLRPATRRFALLPATLCALIYLLICGDPSAISALGPSLGLGVVLFGLYDRLLRTIKTAPEDPGQAPDPLHWQLLCLQERQDRARRQLSDLSAAFGGLGEVFRQLDEKLPRHSPAQLRALCEQAMDDLCPTCPSYAHCHEEQALETLTALSTLTGALQGRGRVEEEHLPPDLRERCSSRGALLTRINEGYAKLTFDSYARLTEGGQAFSEVCRQISHLFRDAGQPLQEGDEAGQLTPEEQKDRRLAGNIARALTEQGLATGQVFITAKGAAGPKILRLYSPLPEAKAGEDLRRTLGDCLGAPLAPPVYSAAGDGYLTYTTLPALRADYVHRTLAAPGGPKAKKPRPGEDPAAGLPCSGDALRVFEGPDGLFYALLCDGMGKGPSAAMTSGVCALFLERTLRAGVEVTTALGMLNEYLRARSRGPEEEVSSTVDLLILDLYSGEARFVKSGAAPSLIFREGRLFRLSSHTFPIGILHATDLQIIPFRVQPGDRILLMSDGVCDLPAQEAEKAEQECPGELPWESLLSESTEPDGTSDEALLIQRLFSMARAAGSQDDMSVISIRISKESA